MPSSPPKKLCRMCEPDETSSAMPSEIMAKTVPARFVEIAPNRMPKARPASPPTSGISGSGIGRRLSATTFIAWTVKKAPRP